MIERSHQTEPSERETFQSGNESLLGWVFAFVLLRKVPVVADSSPIILQ